MKTRTLTTSEVARLLGVTNREVINLCRRGIFPNARKTIGRTSPWLIPESDVTKEIERRAVRTSTSLVGPD